MPTTITATPTAPTVHRAHIDDVEVATSVQAQAGQVTVTLALTNLLSTWPDGSPVEAEVALLPCEAELIAYRLLGLVESTRGVNR